MMRYTENQLDAIFPGRKENHIEKGLRRIPLFYADFPVKREIGLQQLTDEMYGFEDNCVTIPTELYSKRDKLARETLETLDKVYMSFLELIEDEAANSAHKTEMLEYLNSKDLQSVDTIKQMRHPLDCVFREILIDSFVICLR